MVVTIDDHLVSRSSRRTFASTGFSSVAAAFPYKQKVDAHNECLVNQVVVRTVSFNCIMDFVATKDTASWARHTYPVRLPLHSSPLGRLLRKLTSRSWPHKILLTQIKSFGILMQRLRYVEDSTIQFGIRSAPPPTADQVQWNRRSNERKHDLSKQHAKSAFTFVQINFITSNLFFYQTPN